MAKFSKYLLKTAGSILLSTVLSYVIETTFESIKKKTDNRKMKEA